MNRRINFAFILIIGFTLLAVASCGEKAPPNAPPKVVKQKIASPSPPSENKASAAVSTQIKKAPETTPASTVSNADKGSDLIKESLEVASTYDPKGRFDPFEPLFQEKPKADIETSSGEKPQRRTPQTPLEKVALSQLKLTAIIRAPSGNRGLVVDATGKGYVVEKGTYIGLNSGRVIRIENDRIVIEEEIENIMGQLNVQQSELKLLKPVGEL